MNREALVVGINRYPFLKDTPTSQARHLRTPAEDAEAIAKILETYGNFRVERLPTCNQDGAWRVDPNPVPGQLVRVTDLKEAIAKLFNPPSQSIPDTAVLFFAGHGLREHQGGVSEGFLATSEACPQMGQWGVSLRWLRELLQSSPVRQQIVWLDCCYSGELLNFDEADPGNLGIARDRCLIAASREFEVAYEELSGNHGVLTNALLSALNPQQHPDGWVTNYSLVDSIRQQLQTSRQRPIFHNIGSEIILTGKKEKIDRAVLMAGVCPYKGLTHFDFNQEDPKYFYGRTALTDQLLEKVRKGNFLAVLGASGSGKSSVVRAGLLHQLKLGQRLGGSHQWVIKIFRPGEHPLESLAMAFAKDESFNTYLKTRLTNAINSINRGAVGLKSLIQTTAKDRRLVLVVDQFEEAFTLCQDQTERQQFIECLLRALKITENQLCVILTMRADFFGKCAEPDYAELASKIQEHLVTVTPMSREQLEQAITEPAKKVGLEVQRELVAQMLSDVEGPGSLPLLQYTLTEMWQQRQVNRLTLAEYSRLGGVKGTLQKRADEVYQSLSAEEQLSAKRIFLELTQLGEGTEDTRRQVFKADLVNEQQSAALVEEVLRKLADARLVVTSELKVRGEGEKTVTVVDVAHEALIRHWSLLRQWVNENREAIRRERKIEEAAEEWNSKGKPKDMAFLLQGAKLVEAETFLLDYSDLGLLSSLAQEFVQVSKAESDRRLKEFSEREQREFKVVRTRNQILVSALLLVSAVAIGAFFQWKEAEKQRQTAQKQRTEAEKQRTEAEKQRQTAQKQRTEAEKQRQTAQKQRTEAEKQRTEAEKQRQTAQKQEKIAKLGESAAVATNLLSLTPLYGLMRAIKATGESQASPQEVREKTFPQVQSSLYEAISVPIERNILKGHQDVVYSVAFSPDGKTIVSGAEDKTIRLWDTSGKPIGQPLKGHHGWVNSVAFSPDGKTIVSGAEDKTIRLWDTSGKPIGQPLTGHQLSVNSVAFSPDGKTIVSGSNDNTIRLWDTSGKPIGQPFKGHQGWVKSVAFSPDGKTIVSGSNDNTIRLWDTSGKPIGQPFKGHQGWVYSVAFSPDGKTIVSGSNDNTIRLWDTSGNLIGQPFKGHQGWVKSVAFSPDGKTIVSGSLDNTIRLWDTSGKPIGQPLKGHQGWVNSVAFSPDGKTIVSGSIDKTIRLWDTSGKPIGQPLTGHQGWVYSVAFSPDGKTIVSGSIDNTIRLWDTSGKPIGQPFKGHQGWVKSVAFSPDGKTIVSGSLDNTIRLWDTSGKPIGQPLKGHQGWVNSVAFSPDGKTIVSGSIDKTIRLWDTSGKPIGQPFKGHQLLFKSVAFSPDGKTIVSGSNDHTIRLWDRSGQPIGQPFKGHQLSVNSVSFSPDGKTIVSGAEDNTIRLWDTSGKPIGQPFKGHQGWVNSVAFSPDGKTIVSGSLDNTIRLWDRSGTPIGQPLKGHQGWVYSVSFSPDGKTIVSGSNDHTIRLWRGGTWHDWLGVACNQLIDHPILVDPKTTLAEDSEMIEVAKGAGETCQKLAWNPAQKAHFLVNQGRAIGQGGDFDGAMRTFQDARNLSPSIQIPTEAEVRWWAANGQVNKGEELVKEGKVKESFAAYREAQKLKPTWKLSSESWNTLCRYGGLHGYAKDVMFACEKAVALAPEDGMVRDSRGLARALTGNKKGAIEDFQALSKWAEKNEEYKDYKAQRQRWIATIRAGKNPFTPEEIKRLLNQ